MVQGFKRGHRLSPLLERYCNLRVVDILLYNQGNIGTNGSY